MSLRQYTIDVLARHVARPSMDEWLDRLDELPPVPGHLTGAEAVAEGRADDDERLDGRSAAGPTGS